MRVEPDNRKLGAAIIHLMSNVGYQKAISLKLAYVAKEEKWMVVVVIGADGEDKPEQVEKSLCERLQQPDKIIFCRAFKTS
jgi:hypothetical protein